MVYKLFNKKQAISKSRITALCLASGYGDAGGFHVNKFGSCQYKMNFCRPFITLLNKATAAFIMFLIFGYPLTQLSYRKPYWENKHFLQRYESISFTHLISFPNYCFILFIFI